ncbi:MAG: flavin reductase family protein [Nitrospiraceae bacterium]|nr:MAG: flavin reductase family protein [Nitrospiraceae bacterium]
MKKSLGAKTIVYPTPVFVVGTYDKEGKPNVMTASWGGICCSSPPCIAVSLRKATHSYGNVVEQKAFTINIPSETYAREADYFGIVSGKNTDKFGAAGLTPVKSDLVSAPYIREFPFALECRLLHTIEVGLHVQFIGEILDIKAEESVLNEKGSLDIEKVQPFLFAPEARTYHRVGSVLGKAFSIGKEIEMR